MKNMKDMKDMNPKAPKGILFWFASLIIIFLLWSIMTDVSGTKPKELSFTEFMNKVEHNQIMTANISANSVSGKLGVPGSMVLEKDLRKAPGYRTAIPLDFPNVYEKLIANNVKTNVEPLNKNEWLSAIFTWLPFVVILAFWVFMMRQQGGGRAFSFGKSRARMFTGEREKTTFKDVAGIDEAKDELTEIIEFLKEPKKFQRLGGKIPRGVLLIGSPGTGKTLLARAIAGEAKVPFFTISGSDFVELFVGVGASRVRDLFEEGKKHSPCLIFIDEIDAVGRQRGAGLGGGHDEREQTLNALLVEMDGFDRNVGIIIIAATNRPDILDTALLRPGRFDRRITVPTPDVKGRVDILKVHTRKIPLSKSVDLNILARGTPGFTGADLANLINEAALFASRKGKKKLDMKDFEYAKDKVLMGVERKSMIISDSEKEMTAYHEAGHALLSCMLDEADPLHKVSIIPRGMALGITMQLPLTDRHSYSKSHLEAQLCVLLAGRISEEIFLNKITSGSGNDFERATGIARQMVCEWGMSSLGTIRLGQSDDAVFLGREIMTRNEYSEETARKIDAEIKRIIDAAYKEAADIITKNRETLENIAKMLLERETLSSNNIDDIIQGKKLKPLKPLNDKKSKKKDDEEDNIIDMDSDDDADDIDDVDDIDDLDDGDIEQ